VSRPLAAFAMVAVASAVAIWTLPRSAGPPRALASPPASLAAPRVVAAPAAAPTVAARSTHGSPVARRAAPQRPAPAPGTASASRIARDPATGQLAAPEYGAPVTIDEMQAAARREAQGLVTIHNADGSETINHQGRFVDQVVVRMGPDGRPIFLCTHGKAGVEHAMAPAGSVRSSLEDR